MLGERIIHILRTNPATSYYFAGLNPYDIDLPKFDTLPAIIVLNTDKLTGKGEHWCVANFLPNNACEFFDPYGILPCFHDFDKILYKRCSSIYYNSHRVQGLFPVCGHHCLFYILQRYWGNTPATVLNMYSKDLIRNDLMVYKFIVENFGESFARIDQENIHALITATLEKIHSV